MSVEKKHIRVESVSTSRPVGKTEILDFKGADGIVYEVWKGPITEHVVVGKEFDADVEYTEKPGNREGSVFKHWTIRQIYVGGQVVGERKAGGPGGFGGKSFGKSPEVLAQEHRNDLELEAVKRRSIEGQQAMMEVGLFLRDIAPDEKPSADQARIIAKYWTAVEKSLDAFLTTPAAVPTQSHLAKAAEAIGGQKIDEPPKEAPPVQGFKDRGQFFTKVKDVFSLMPSQIVLKYPEVQRLADGGDLNNAYLKLAELIAGKK